MPKAHPITLVLSGIGGYGEQYLNTLLDPHSQARIRLVGAADPAPQGCSRLAELRDRGVPIFDSLDAFYAAAGADLAVIAAPIHEHCRQACLALAHGSHVLCEKPAAATVQDADRMADARDRAGRVAGIGYQWSFAPAILDLKRDILAGRFGRATRVQSTVLWPRTDRYYARNRWAGRQKTAQGAWVLDSPVNNAAAHYLHNMLFLLGDGLDRSAAPASVQAELYRANPIENYDTAALRCITAGGAEILFYTSHAVSDTIGPLFRLEFERGVAALDGADGAVVARFDDGDSRNYGAPDSTENRKLWAMADAISGGRPVPCGIEAARAQVVCMNGAQESAPIADFDPRAIRTVSHPNGTLTCVPGLAESLLDCAGQFKLPSELGLPWARAGRVVDLRGYARFPGG